MWVNYIWTKNVLFMSKLETYTHVEEEENMGYHYYTSCSSSEHTAIIHRKQEWNA